jgi:histone H3/H4
VPLFIIQLLNVIMSEFEDDNNGDVAMSVAHVEAPGVAPDATPVQEVNSNAMVEEMIQIDSNEGELSTVGDGSEHLQSSPLGVIKKKLRSDIKHPLTAWLLFSAENREIISKEQPSLGFKDIARVLAERYRNLSAAEKDRLETLVKLDKERYNREMEEAISYELELGVADNYNKDRDKTLCEAPGSLSIPVGRVRKIVKLDDDVKNVSKEALSVITKATELFIAYLGVRCTNTSAQRGSRSVRETDLVKTIHTLSALDFLRLDFPRSVDGNTEPNRNSNRSTTLKTAVHTIQCNTIQYNIQHIQNSKSAEKINFSTNFCPDQFGKNHSILPSQTKFVLVN